MIEFKVGAPEDIPPAFFDRIILCDFRQQCWGGLQTAPTSIYRGTFGFINSVDI
jgi:hypothetical protein